MPELPDIDAYVHATRAHLLGQPLEAVRLASPFLLRTVTPRPQDCVGLPVDDVRRLGKRVVLGFSADEGPIFFVFHLMIAGRLRWKKRGAALPKRGGLLALDFPEGSLVLTEVSKKKRAKLHVVSGEAALAEHDPGGLEPLEIDAATFRARLSEENHTIKRSLTDPRILSGIGNAYSDEILHRARVSPVRWTSRLDDDAWARLYEATQEVLTEWRQRLIDELDGAYPDKVTAFRPEMAAHGKYGKPCPVCGDPIQRIKYASNETNYCATCQTDGKLLADRGLSRLLKGDWPKSLEQLEEFKRERRE